MIFDFYFLRNKYSCPICKINLKEYPPVKITKPWYMLVNIKTLRCTGCKTELIRRFTSIDELLIAIGLCCGNPFAFSAIKILLPLVLALLIVRFLAGLFFSVYKISKPE